MRNEFQLFYVFGNGRSAVPTIAYPTHVFMNLKMWFFKRDRGPQLNMLRVDTESVIYLRHRSNPGLNNLRENPYLQ